MYYYRQIKQYCPLRHWGAQGAARLVKDAARMLNEVDSTALTYLGRFKSLRLQDMSLQDLSRANEIP